MQRVLTVALTFLLLFTFNESKAVELDQHVQTMMAINKFIGSVKTRHPQAKSSEISHGPTTQSECSGGIAGEISGIDADFEGTVYIYAYPTMDSIWGDGEISKGYATLVGNGTYQIDMLCAGSYYVSVQAEGYEELFYDHVYDMFNASMVGVQDGSITEQVDFAMEKIVPGSSSISGTVVQESDYEPIPDAYIMVNSLNFSRSYDGYSNDDGSYHITGIKSGTYYVSAYAKGYFEEYFDNIGTFEGMPTPVVVIEPEAKSDINFSLTRAGSISGYIRDQNNNPVIEANVFAYPALKDTGVFIDPIIPDPFARFAGIAVLDSTGKYEIPGLIQGKYYVCVETWLSWNFKLMWYPNVFTQEEAVPVDVYDGQETSGIDFQINIEKPDGVIFGTVVDEAGHPVPDVYIQAQSNYFEPYFMPFWSETMTNAEGQYRIEGLLDGEYLVSAYVNSGWQYVQRWWPDAESPDQATPVVVADDVIPQPTDFILPVKISTGSISGYVMSIENVPLIGANIVLTSSESEPVDGDGIIKNSIWAYGYSDSTGYYLIDHLPAGSYVAQASYWSYESFGQQYYDHVESEEDATPIQLGENEARNDISFALTVRPMYGSIVGTVIDSTTGMPIYRAFVEITPTQWYPDLSVRPFYFWNYSTTTDESGQYAFDGLFEGEYLVSVYTNGAFEYYEDAVTSKEASPGKVVGGIKTEIDFYIIPRNEGSGSISGLVVSDWDSTQFEIAVVTAKPVVTITEWPFSEMFYTAVTEKDGSFIIKGLPDGDYYVNSFTQNGIGEYYDNVFDPTLATPVHVQDGQPTTGIDFELSYAWYLDYAKGHEDAAGNTAVNGQVFDNNSNPIAGATILVLNEAGQPIASVRTGANGNYEINGLPPGNYILQAGNIGFMTQFNGNVGNFGEATPVNVNSGSMEINFVLQAQNSSKIDKDADKLPTRIELLGNYPNPFNPDTNILFALPRDMNVKVNVYNVKGEHVALLVEGVLRAGRHSLKWDGLNQDGQGVSSGMYFYRLQSADMVKTGKMLLVR